MTQTHAKTEVVTHYLPADLEAAAHQDALADERPYWYLVREPLACLIFLTPLLLMYEVGVFWLGGSSPEDIRNGADSWMRSSLTEMGVEYYWMLPLLVIILLIGWHCAGRFRWKVSGETLVGMFAESLLFAFLLIVVAQGQDYCVQHFSSEQVLSIGHSSVHRCISFLGAGIYEEVLFRLCLLPACYGFFRLIRVRKSWSAFWSILVTSLLFSLAHHIGPTGEEFTLYAFAFRALAGGIFSLLFVLRGFGITVGAHAAYDLIAGILMTTG